jgi:hypothetical protein
MFLSNNSYYWHTYWFKEGKRQKRYEVEFEIGYTCEGKRRIYNHLHTKVPKGFTYGCSDFLEDFLEDERYQITDAA